MHLYVALINYKENTIEKVENLTMPSCVVYNNKNNQSNLNKTNFFMIDSIVNYFHKNDFENKLTNNTNTPAHQEFLNLLFKDEFCYTDYIEFKLFEKYFVKYLIIHFSKVIQQISGKEDMYLSGIKLKNIYYIDLQSQSVIYCLNKMNPNNLKEKPKPYKNEALWDYLLSLIQYLEANYSTETRQRDSFCGNDFEFYRNYNNSPFIKFEMTSTYPRYSFFIKYLPILGGLGIIHEYTQKKLSRMTNPEPNSKNTLLTQDHFLKKKYYEFKTIYNLTMNKCENNNNNNNNQNINPLTHLNNVSSIHSDAGSNGGNSSIIKYLEPEPLLKVEKFFIEFFLASKKQEDIFYCPKENMMPKYFNMDIVKIINSISSSKETSLEDIMYQIEQKLIKLEPIKNNGNINLQIVTGHKKKKEPSKLDKLFNINYKILLTDLLEHKIEGKKEENGKCPSTFSNTCCVTKQQIISDKKGKNELRHIHSFTPFGKHSIQEIHKSKTGIITGSEGEIYVPKDKTTHKNNDNTLLNGNENDMTSLSGSKWDNFSKDNITLNLSRKLSEIKVNGIVNGINDKEVQSGGGTGNFWNTRKISFIDDFRNDNTRLEDDLNYSQNRCNNNHNNVRYFAENSEEALIIKDKPLIPRKMYQTCCLHYKDNLIPQHNKSENQHNKELQQSTVKNRTKFTSLMLGGLYRKDVAVNKLFIPEDHADFGKQLTFHKDT